MSIENYFGRWLGVLDREELCKATAILDRLYPQSLICPDKKDVFRAFNICKYEDLQVVMIGQDPYPQRGVATGILFGNRADIPEESLSPSLKVIREAVIDPEISHGLVKFDNTMESWARQGILMINSALTVEMNRIGSHTMLWRPFMTKLLKNLSEVNPSLIYVLFGGQAQSLKPYIGSNNIIFEPKHPAYYARLGQRFKTTLFKDINAQLAKKNNTKIIWYEES